MKFSASSPPSKPKCQITRDGRGGLCLKLKEMTGQIFREEFQSEGAAPAKPQEQAEDRAEPGASGLHPLHKHGVLWILTLK